MSFASQEQVDTISALTSQLYRYYSTAYYEGVYSGKLDKAIEHDLIPWLLEFKKEVVAAGCNLDSMGVYFRMIDRFYSMAQLSCAAMTLWTTPLCES